MSRQKARTAPSNQASLYDDKPELEPASKSARLPSDSYASSSTANSRRSSSQQQQPSSQNTRSSISQAPPRRTSQPSQSRVDEDDRPAAPNRRLARHQEEEEEDNVYHPPPISSGGDQPDEYADDVGEMAECGNCHRRFNVVSLAKHQKICEKVFTGQRKVFNMAAKRLQGTEAEKLLKEASRKGGKRGSATASNDEKPIKAKAADWKQQSNAFREAMRANRQIEQAVKEGKPLPAMAPSAPDPSLIPCDYCGRRFNEKAAERHIPFCKDKAQRTGGGPPKKPTAGAAPAAKPAASRAPPPRKR